MEEYAASKKASEEEADSESSDEDTEMNTKPHHDEFGVKMDAAEEKKLIKKEEVEQGRVRLLRQSSF